MSDRKIVLTISKNDGNDGPPSDIKMETEGDVNAVDAIYTLYGAVGNVVEMLLRSAATVVFDTKSHIFHEELMEGLAPHAAKHFFENVKATLTFVDELLKLIESKDEKVIRDWLESRVEVPSEDG
jgi:hypothetical protein